MHIRRQVDRRAPRPALVVLLTMFTSGFLASNGVIGGNGGGGAPLPAPHGQGKAPIASSSSSSFFKGVGSNSVSSAFSSSSNHGREGGGGGASMEGQGEGNPHIGVLVMKSRKGGVEEEPAPPSLLVRLSTLLSLLALLAGLASLGLHLLLLLSTATRAMMTWSEIVVRLYACSLTLFLLLAEARGCSLLPSLPPSLGGHATDRLFSSSPSLHHALPRSLLLLFLGAQLNLPSLAASALWPLENEGGKEEGVSPVRVVAVAMMAVAVGQAAVSLVCCSERNRGREKGRTRRRKPLPQDVHSLQAQKFEIERLLAETDDRLMHL